MKLLSWHDWLDKHIPYYEAERHRTRFLDNPPQVVLVIAVIDRQATTFWKNWEDVSNRIDTLNYQSSPLFLERDTHQNWYWAFWNEQEALMTLLKLT
jgi:hypothetical protein